MRDNPLRLQQRRPRYVRDNDALRIGFAEAISFAVERARKSGVRQVVTRAIVGHDAYRVQAWR